MYNVLVNKALKLINWRYFPYLLIIVLPLIVFRQALWGNAVFALGDFSGSDLLELHLPFKYILHDAYTHGSFPLWSPYLSNGFPILAEGQSGPLYPPHILLAFLPPVVGLNYSIILSFIIAGCGAYTFARKLPTMQKTGAVAFAVIFMFSSFFIARIKHINMIAVAAYLPWCLWCIKNYFTKFELKWFVYLGLCWGMQILAGHPQMFYFASIMCLWYAAGELAWQYLSLKVKSNNIPFTLITLKMITGLITSGVLALGCAAAQIIPTLELTKLSSRQDFSYEVATAYPLRPKFLATLFAPFFLGNPATGSYRGNIQTDGIWWENVVYIGLLPLLIFLIMLFFQIKKLRLFGKMLKSKQGEEVNRFTYYYWFFILSAFLFYVLSTGSYTFLFSVLYYNLPAMNLFRFPTRFNLMTILALSLTTAWGVQKVLFRLESSRVYSSIKKKASSDYVFSWPFSYRVSSVLLIGVIVLDLSVFADQYISYYPVNQYLENPSTVKEIKKDPYLFRIYPMTQYSQNPFGVMGWKKGESAIRSLQKAIPGNFSAVYSMFSFTDRGWFEGGLGLKERAYLENFIIKNNLPAQQLSTIFGLWNVKYILGFAELPPPQFTPSGSYDLDASFGVPLKVYKNESAMPRAFFVQDIQKINGSQPILQKLLDPNQSPEEWAYSETEGKEIKEEAAQSRFSSDDFKSGHSVSIINYQATEVSMRTKTADDAILVFSDTFYPGWKAFIDGKEKPIIKVNIIMRAVKVPRGEHNIIWSYQPIAFYAGFGISFATLITVLSYILIGQRERGEPKRGER